uniref:Uncharacterized protein n=1 Tax=Anguilla anguilla TaxID=7936 RepID=A0A0E9XDA4_ANGAN
MLRPGARLPELDRGGLWLVLGAQFKYFTSPLKCVADC